MPFFDPPLLPDFVADSLPFQRRVYRLEEGLSAGLHLHFVDHGPQEARPVLFQHGNPTWSFLWRGVIYRLGELRCVAPDLLGLGLSDRLQQVDDHSLERHADAIAHLVEALDLRGIILVGQDWGGPVVTSVGARHPDRIAGVVLANTSVLVPKHPKGTLFHRFSHFPVVSDVAFRLLGFPLWMLHRVQRDRSSLAGRRSRPYRWPLGSWKDRVAPLALARMVPNRPDHPSLGELARGEAWLRSFTGPVTLVWGEQDPILGRALARHQRQLPRAKVVHTNAGHFLQEEVPEVLAAEIQEMAGKLAG